MSEPIKKYSIGIACCRQKDKSSMKEILLVQRRTTYAFLDLIMGRYKIRDFSRIKFLIKNMTAEEQNELLTKNFEMIWWKATRYKKEDNPELYTIKNSKFELVFNTIYDLKTIISQSSSIIQQWEIPKGRHSYKKECDINCAVREFNEETNIKQDDYQIIFNPINYSYQESGYTYITKYYPAMCHYFGQMGYTRPTDKNQVCEIVALRWMNIQMVKAVCSGRVIKLVKRIFERF